MAGRPIKKGLTWFSMDVNMDQNFEALEELHQNDGFVWLVKFWQEAYRSNSGIVDLNDIRGIIAARKARISTDKQVEIVKDCIRLGLLSEVEPGKYTSSGIQARLDAVLGKRENDRNLNKNELPDNNRGDNTAIRGDSKEKEIKENEIKGENKIKIAFSPPIIDEIRSYCLDRGNSIDADKFHSHYESNGWMVGRNKMKDWKAAIRTWEKNEKGGAYGTGKGFASGRFVGEFEKGAADKYKDVSTTRIAH